MCRSVVVSLGLGVDFPNRLSRKKRGGCGCGMTPPRRLRARNGQSLFHGLCLCHPISWFDPPLPLANESWHGFTPPQVIPSPFHACSPPIDLGTMTIIFRLPERAGVEVGVEARPLPTHEHRCRHLMVWCLSSPRARKPNLDRGVRPLFRRRRLLRRRHRRSRGHAQETLGTAPSHVTGGLFAASNGRPSSGWCQHSL